MQSLYSTAVASSSRHTIDDYLDTSKTCSFPTSDLRSAHWRPTTPSAPPPPDITSSDTRSSPCLLSTKYPTALPRRTQIQLGVWWDGCDTVFSSDWPDVQNFLRRARKQMSLPLPLSETVFALAALEVFYDIEDPVHWMFWSDGRKERTAEVVNRISRACIVLSF